MSWPYARWRRPVGTPAHGFSRSPVSVLLYAAVFGYLGYAVFLHEHGVPRSEPGRGAFLLGELAGGMRISQTMTLEAGGFNQVTIRAQPHGTSVRGDVIFELKELVGDGERVLYRIVRPAEEVVAARYHTVAFPPIEESRGRRYRFEIWAPTVEAGAGIAVWASRDDRYAEGALFIGPREQWGDLAFRTSASRATIFRNAEHALREQPAVVRSRWSMMAAFFLCGWALVAFIRGMVVEPEG